MYHYVTCEGVVYLCITDDVSVYAVMFTTSVSLISLVYVKEFERSKAFLFLEDIKDR